MKKLFGLIFNRWVLLVLLLLFMLAVIWIVGPMVAIGEWRPLDGVTARWIVSGVLLGACAVWLGWRAWRARRGNQKVVEQLMAAPVAGPAAPAESADMAAVRGRFEAALQTLRNARFGAEAGGLPSKPSFWQRTRQSLNGRFLYELPWYTIIGAPGQARPPHCATPGCGSPWPTRWASRRCAVLAARATAIGGSPTRRC